MLTKAAARQRTGDANSHRRNARTRRWFAFMAACAGLNLTACQSDPAGPVPLERGPDETAPEPDHEAGRGAGASIGTRGPANDTGPSGFPAPSGDLPNWRLVHVDGFERDTVGRPPYTIYNHGVSGDKPTTSYWKRNHVLVENGRLVLLGRREKVTVEGKESVRMVTGAVTLWLLPKQTYGRYEVAVRIDRTPGMSYAWLLWPYEGDNWPAGGEVDFAEDHGGNRASTRATYNYGRDGIRRVLPQHSVTPERDFSQWHVLGVEWLPGKLRYLLDGTVWATNTSPEIADQPMVLVLQTEGMLADPPAGTYRAEIDWVAVYARR